MPKLTDRFIGSFAPAPGAKDRLAFDTEVKGLGLRATSAGNKVFILQWTDSATGRKVRESLGTWGAVTVEQARDAARIRLGRMAAGFDPKAEREAKLAEDARRRAAATAAKIEAAFILDTLIEDWGRLHLSSRRPRYAAEAQRALRLAFASQLRAPAGALRHEAVLAVLDGLVSDGKSATARLTMAYGRACYGWAVKRRRLALNPFAGLPPIEGGATTRDRVLREDELGQVWRAALAVPTPHGPMIRFLMLTLARREEVAGMTWGEIAADLSTWTQPGQRTKNGKPHIIHLSSPARNVLRELLGVAGRTRLLVLPASDLCVFAVAGNRPISAHSWTKRSLDLAITNERQKASAKCSKAFSSMPPWVLHDFRRTGVTWLASAGFPPHVADRLLNHLGGTISGVAAIYQRGEFADERKAALDAWGSHVLKMGEPKPQLQVDQLAAASPLRRHRK